jgi:hypothetical protein
MKIRPVGAESFHADGRTDRTKLIVAFRNFAKQLKKYKDPRSEFKAVLPLAYVSRPTKILPYLTHYYYYCYYYFTFLYLC